MKQSPHYKFNKKPLVIGIAAAMMSLAVTNANAVKFQLGNFDISFDSTFSLGTSIRTQNRDWGTLISKSNNINNGFDFSNYHAALNANPNSKVIWQGEGGYSNNVDNGDLNYDAGQSFSTLFKGLHELDIRNGNIGLFVRGMYYYDFETMDKNRPWTNPVSGQQSSPCRDSEARSLACQDVRLLDAFVYGDFEVAGMPLSVRVGDQVINWGESTFIAHGISELNPVDVARLKAPGAELKEAFIPYGAVWASLGVTENFNIEAFYQYRWEQTLLPVPGSYFSTNDFAGEGGQYNNVSLGFSGGPDIDATSLLAGLNEVGDMMRSGDPALQAAAAAMYLAYPTKVTLRAPGDYAEIQPKDGGQYGLRLSWYLEGLNDTELSVYYMNYHSRRPLFSGKTADFTSASIAKDLSYLAQNNITMDNLYNNLGAFSQVKLAYPEDIKLYAMSFNSYIGTTAIAGEITYRQNEPLQIDDVELLFAAMPQQLANAGIRPDLDGISQMPVFGSGVQADGFILSDTVQAQMTLTQLFGPTFGADQFTGLFEIGGVNINDMPDPNVLRLNSPGNARSGGFPIKNGLELGVQNGLETNPFPDAFSWGYRVLAILEYDNVFAGVNVLPRLVYSEDVSGTTPDPLFLFVEGRKSLAIGVNFDYQSRWSANFTYNSFWGGVGSANALSDRDYISFNIKYSI